MSDNGTTSENGAMTAAEYVLGVLSAEERRAVERRIVRDAVFAREVAFWEERLGGLANEIQPIAPPENGWARIEAALDGTKTSREERGGIWQSLSFWRGLAIGTSALAAASLAALIFVTRLPDATGPLIAQIASESGQPSFYAAVNQSGTNITILPTALLTGEEQRAFELWLIPAGEKPHSLGLIDPSKPVKVTIPPDLKDRVDAQSVLAVSLEPPGGSPTGQPTGPVIANGKLTNL